MSENQAGYKSRTWGGRRVPGPGKKLGTPKKLDEYIRIQISVDQQTLDALDKVCPGNRSKAVRILAGTDTAEGC